MYLTHTCPKCGKNHEHPSTPEPDVLCPDCQPKILINPPPRDRRCECCGRHVSELKPFGKAGDPLVGDFDGVLLLKNFRSMSVANAKLRDMQKVWKDLFVANAEDFCATDRAMIEKYGKEKIEEFYFADQLCNTVSASWECRDCFVLDDEEYYEKRNKRC